MTELLSPQPTNPVLRAWNSVVAWFFCCHPDHTYMVPRRHWSNHCRLVTFVVCGVLPLCAVSWGHLIGLLSGPRSNGLSIVVAGTFMMGVTLLMDSMLCGALAQRRFTTTTFAVFCFRWLFAICAATSMSIGAVLLIMGDQLARERAEQELAVQESDRLRVSQIHDLAKLEKSAETANAEVAQARTLFVIPPPIVSSLIASYNSCHTELRKLQEENSRRLPPLNGQRSRLREEIRGIQTSPDDAARQGLPGLTGRLHEVETEIGEFTGRVSRKAKECAGYQTRAKKEDDAHKERAQQMLAAAEDGRTQAESAQRSAKAAADVQLTRLRVTTAQAWSENISAQFKAAWSMMVRDWWARLAAAMVFVFCVIVEISPMLGKIALRGGPLDQLGELEEEVVHQRVLTQLAAVKAQGEAERAVLLEDRIGQVEIVSIRKAAESVFDNAEVLRQRRDIVRGFPDMKDMANTVFATARDKMRDIVLRLMGTAR